ncbi:hypothetical protein CC78DRAFT_583218 [Lojkania enalia]|uniref:Fe2OG dioxygenase domain-containing protein n=1 Tax=Lojkania enalia TaxID=147567 RepID=A0A9P4N0Z3_9PLEO|nr:hypothetical protein CC78DRAFT_583218 [Didymosphaeria enalia]
MKESRASGRGAELLSIALFFALPLTISTALWTDTVQEVLPNRFQGYLSASSNPEPASIETAPDTAFSSCESHKYTTEIVSLDPLVIYINNFTTHQEADELIAAGESDFQPSYISTNTGLQRVQGRTSSSAPLSPSLPLVQCILTRARTFMGSTLSPTERFSTPQLVRYERGQKYDLHTDHWPSHQVDDQGRLFNRVASFFVFLRGECEEGETYFPEVEPWSTSNSESDPDARLEKTFKGKVLRGEYKGEKKGVKFKPITGNAVFWVNIDAKGEGDGRLIHAGLPVGGGEKVGMNIWPRKFYGWEDGSEPRVKKEEVRWV